MERRKYKRVPFEVKATVHTPRMSIEGTVDNLSMKGMLLASRDVLPGDSPLEITITLSGSTSMLSIKLKGRMVRQIEAGIAIEFLEMDLDSFTHLRCIVAQNSDDPDAVYEEYYRSITSK